MTQITLRYGWLLGVAYWWCFGLYAALYDHHYGHLQRVVVFLLALAGAMWYQRCNFDLQARITIERRSILIYAFISVLAFWFSWPYLTASLNGDQLYHAQWAQHHFLPIANYLAATPIAADVPYRALLSFVDAVALLCLALLIWQRPSYRVISLTALFLLLRIWGISQNASYDPHPPLRLLPLWLSSTLLGHTAFSYKLPQFIVWLLGLFSLQRITQSRLGLMLSFAFAITAMSMPIMWHIACLVESSIFSAVLLTCLLCHLYFCDTLNDFPWRRWVVLIALCSLIRVPSILAFIPLGMTYFSQNPMPSKARASVLIFSVCLCLPIFIQSIINGTPATFTPENAFPLPIDAHLIERLWYAFSQGYVWKGISASLSMAWLVCLLGLTPLVLQKEKRWIAFTIFSSLGILFAAYYSVKPGLWVYPPRYRAEFLAPFLILGLGCLCAQAKSRFMRTLVWIVLIVLFCQNVLLAKNWYSERLRVSEIPYPYDYAYTHIKTHALAGRTLSAGVTYGTMSEVLAGYTAKQTLDTLKLWERHLSPSSDRIVHDRMIQAVLIDPENKPSLATELKSKGWKNTYFYTDNHPYPLVLSTRA